MASSPLFLSALFSYALSIDAHTCNESADNLYTTDFICSLFEKEGRGLFDVRQAILGHLQQGGDPSPFDRLLATRLAKRCVEFLIEEAGQSSPAGAFVGVQGGEIQISNLEDLPQDGNGVKLRGKEVKSRFF